MMPRAARAAAALVWPLVLATACSAVPGLGTVGEGEPSGSPAASGPPEMVLPPADAAVLRGAGAAAEREVAAAPAADGRVFGAEALAPDPTAGDRVLAVVDGEEIRASSLYRTLFLENPLWAQNALQSEVLLILARKEAARQGIVVGAAEVERSLDQTVEEHRARCAAFVDENATLEEFVEEFFGLSFEEYREELRRTAVFNLLLNRCIRHQEMQHRRYRIGIIVVSQRATADDVREKLANGANFEVLARKWSVDRSSGGGGVLTPIPDDPRHPLHPLVEQAHELPAGGVSAVRAMPALSDEVFRILKVIEILEPAAGDFSACAGAVEESLAQDPVDLAAIEYWQACMRERYNIEAKGP